MRLAATAVPTPPERARRAGVLALVAETPEGLGFVYTRRREDLRHHPGQISFPGGRVEPGESIEQAAVREAQEEIGLDPASITVLGRLEPFYLPPSRFWLSPVLAAWDAPHPLVAAPGEVAEVLRVPLSRLLDPDALRIVRLSSSGWSWAWQLDGDHILWGATGRVTAEILDLLAPGWAPEGGPDALGPRRVVEPWRGQPVADWRRLPDLPTVEASGLPAPVVDLRPWVREAAAVAARLVPGGAPVLALVGAGGCGRLATAVAEELSTRHPVRRVAVGDPDAAGRLDPEAAGVDLPGRSTLVIDGLVGRGLHGRLRGGALQLTRAVAAFTPRVLAVDVPSGVDAERGLVGEVLAADVTVAFGVPARGLLLQGMQAFTGDVVAVVAEPGGGAARPVGVAPVADGGWRE